MGREAGMTQRILLLLIALGQVGLHQGQVHHEIRDYDQSTCKVHAEVLQNPIVRLSSRYNMDVVPSVQAAGGRFQRCRSPGQQSRP